MYVLTILALLVTHIPQYIRSTEEYVHLALHLLWTVGFFTEMVCLGSYSFVTKDVMFLVNGAEDLVFNTSGSSWIWPRSLSQVRKISRKNYNNVTYPTCRVPCDLFYPNHFYLQRWAVVFRNACFKFPRVSIVESDFFRHWTSIRFAYNGYCLWTFVFFVFIPACFSCRHLKRESISFSDDSKFQRSGRSCWTTVKIIFSTTWKASRKWTQETCNRICKFIPNWGYYQGYSMKRSETHLFQLYYPCWLQW